MPHSTESARANSRQRTSPPLEDRLLSRMVRDAVTGCWNWQGAKTVGYGSIRVGGRNGRALYAHRLSYEWFRGPIPEGLFIDHLCENRGCINPFHMEVVTQALNNLRRWTRRSASHG